MHHVVDLLAMRSDEQATKVDAALGMQTEKTVEVQEQVAFNKQMQEAEQSNGLSQMSYVRSMCSLSVHLCINVCVCLFTYASMYVSMCVCMHACVSKFASCLLTT